MANEKDEKATAGLISNGHAVEENGCAVHNQEYVVDVKTGKRDSIASPRDNYKMVFMIFLLHGVGVLLPWNVFINAVSYFQDYKFNTTLSMDSEYRNHFLAYIGMASQIPNILLSAANVFFQSSGDSSKQGIRFMVAVNVNIIVLIFTIILAFVDSSEWPYTFFILTIISVIILNSCTGIYQSFIFGLGAMLPMSYSNAIVIGNNLCGTVVSICMIITKAAAGGGTANAGGESLRIAAIYYFFFAVFILMACFGTYFVLPRLAFYRFYTHKEEIMMKDVLLMNGGEKHVEDVEEGSDTDDRSAFQVFRNCFGLCCFCPLRKGYSACSEYWRKYREALPHCWMQCLNVFSVFFCTLSAFPALVAEVRAVSDSFFIPKYWFTDVTCFLFFNLFAMIGNLISNVFQKPGPRWLFIPVWLRTFFFIPFFMFCNCLPDKRVLPVAFGNDYVYMFGMIIFALSSGYLSSLCMMFASLTAPDHLKSISGMLAAFCLISGVVFGVQFSLLWTKIVEGFVH